MVNKWSYPLRMLALPDALGLSSRRETRKGLWPTVGVIVFSIGQCSRRTSLYKAGLPVNKRDHVFCILIPLFQTSLFDKASVAQTKSGFASHPTNDQASCKGTSHGANCGFCPGVLFRKTLIVQQLSRLPQGIHRQSVVQVTVAFFALFALSTYLLLSHMRPTISPFCM